MSVDIVSATQIMTPQKTAKGNDYKKSNIGKYVGTTAGIATGGHFLYTLHKAQKGTALWEAVNETAITTINKLSEILGDVQFSPEELSDEIPKYIKKIFKIGGPAIAAGIVALGLGVGAIADTITNHFIRKSADKKAETNKAE